MCGTGFQPVNSTAGTEPGRYICGTGYQPVDLADTGVGRYICCGTGLQPVDPAGTETGRYICLSTRSGLPAGSPTAKLKALPDARGNAGQTLACRLIVGPSKLSFLAGA